MKRSLQEVVELVIFGLVALLIGTGLLWVVGWLFSLGGLLLKAVAGLLWLLLRFVVPVALVAGLFYFIVKALRQRSEGAPPVGEAAGSAASPASPAPAPPGQSAAGEPLKQAAEGPGHAESPAPAEEGDAEDAG